MRILLRRSNRFVLKGYTVRVKNENPPKSMLKNNRSREQGQEFVSFLIERVGKKAKSKIGQIPRNALCE